MSIIEIINHSAPPDGDTVRRKIRQGLWSCIHSTIITDESSKRLDATCGDDVTFNLNTLAQAFSEATSLDVRAVRSGVDVYHIRVTVNTNRIKNHILDRIGNRLHAMTQSRSPDESPPLAFLDELAKASTNTLITFSFNTNTNIVSNIQNISKKSRNRTWLDNVILRAIENFNGSIWFTGDKENE